MKNDRRKLFLLVCLTTVMFSTTVLAGDINVNGYYKTFFTAIGNPGIKGSPEPTDKLDGLVTNTFRIETSYASGNWLYVKAAYSFSPRIGVNKGNFLQSQYPVPNPFNYRAIDFRSRLYPDPSDTDFTFSLYHNVDRLFFTFKPKLGDIILGRQAISFGSAKIINPTDVLAPFTFQEVDKEERVGVDAIRLRVPVGLMGEFDSGWVFGKEGRFSNSAFFSRIKAYLFNTDMSALIIGFRNNLLLGFDIVRSIGGSTAWIEGAYTFSGIFEGYDSSQNYFRLSTGTDYKLTDKLYGLIEYHYSSAGKVDSGGYLNALSTTAFTEGAAYLVGQHYVSPGIVYEITPLLTLTDQFIINACDPSFFLSAVLNFNIAENIYLDAGAFITLGEGSRVLSGSSAQSLEIGSEFGLYPDTYYLASRFYF